MIEVSLLRQKYEAVAQPQYNEGGSGGEAEMVTDPFGQSDLSLPFQAR